MKHLYDCILEARQTIGELAFNYDLFEKFMQEAIIDGEYDDSQYWEPMKNIIDQHYKGSWNWFCGWCESYLFLKNTKLIDFYNSIKQIPLDRFKRVLGAGSAGIVLDCGDNVIKVFYGENINSGDLAFLRYCATHKSKVFPRVVKIGKNWCVMEKLKMKTQKCIEYMDIINKFKPNGFSFISNIAKGETLKDLSLLNDIQLEVYNWCLQVKKEMDDMKNNQIRYPGDLALKNIGERNNGEIIFFDI